VPKSLGYGEVETSTRFPLLHTPDDYDRQRRRATLITLTGTKDRADHQQLAQAQANAISLQAKLNPAGDRTALDTEQALAANKQVEELRASVEAKDKEIAPYQELLQHDRDI